MNHHLREILIAREGSFLSDADTQALGAYAEGVLARLDTMRTIERAEPAILDDVVEEVMSEYPDMASQHGDDAAQRVRRDQAMLLRYAAMAMLLHDQAFIYDKLAVWLRSIMVAMCHPEQVMLGYRALERACERHLVPEDASALLPFVRIMIEELQPYTTRTT
jgi:hypothetical protein